MKELTPAKVMEQVANAVPAEYRTNIIIVGSLAAGFHFFGGDEEREVRTKDIDCLLSPHDKAIISGQAMADELLSCGWEYRSEGGFGQPQETPEPTETLSAIRLYPPKSKDWFLKLLTVPESENDKGKKWIPVKTKDGYFGLCSFEFLSITAYKPVRTSFGIYYARPEMMALANLLSHPKISPGVMSSPYEGRKIKRSNKDLGRALALARLTPDEKIEEEWPASFLDALQTCFPTRWDGLSISAGTGLRELIENEEDLEEALHTCNASLLARTPLSLDELRATGERFQADVIEELALLVK